MTCSEANKCFVYLNNLIHGYVNVKYTEYGNFWGVNVF